VRLAANVLRFERPPYDKTYSPALVFATVAKGGKADELAIFAQRRA